jgi:hypothetical protein
VSVAVVELVPTSISIVGEVFLGRPNCTHPAVLSPNAREADPSEATPIVRGSCRSAADRDAG